MKGKLMLLAGAAVGYVFGTRAGRERYEQLKQKAMETWHDPRVQEKVSEAEHFVSDTAKHKVPQVQQKVSEKARGAADAAKSRFGNGEPQAGEHQAGQQPGEQQSAALTPDADPTRPPH
jgi:hypothetical protein